MSWQSHRCSRSATQAAVVCATLIWAALAGCGGTQGEAAGPRKPPAWAAGLTIGDPEHTADTDPPDPWADAAYEPGEDDDEELEPIDFPSCEQAQESHVVDFEKPDGHPPDLTTEQFAAILSRGTYLRRCGVDSSSDVALCAAVIDGQAVGVTVELSPFDQRRVNCLVETLRDMSFPAHPRLDIARTRFRAR